MWGCLAHHARLILNPLCPAPGLTAKPAPSGRPDAIAVSYTSPDEGLYTYTLAEPSRLRYRCVHVASPTYRLSNPVPIHWPRNPSSICPGPVRSSRSTLVSGREPRMTHGCVVVFPSRQPTHERTSCFTHNNAHIYINIYKLIFKRSRVDTGEATPVQALAQHSDTKRAHIWRHLPDL